MSCGLALHTACNTFVVNTCFSIAWQRMRHDQLVYGIACCSSITDCQYITHAADAKRVLMLIYPLLSCKLRPLPSNHDPRLPIGNFAQQTLPNTFRRNSCCLNRLFYPLSSTATYMQVGLKKMIMARLSSLNSAPVLFGHRHL